MPTPVTDAIITKQKEFKEAVVHAKKERDEFLKQYTEAQKINAKIWNDTMKAAAAQAQDLQTKLGTSLKEMDEMIASSAKIAGEYDMAYRKLVDAEKYLQISTADAAEAKKKADADKTNKDLAMKSELAAKALVKAKNAFDSTADVCRVVESNASQPLMWFMSHDKQQFNERCRKLNDSLHALDLEVKRQQNGWK